MTDLPPCPFCGSKPRQYSIPTPTEWTYAHEVDHWVSGESDECFASVGMCETAEEATEMWNTRATGWQPIETAPRDGENFLGYGSYIHHGDASVTEYCVIASYNTLSPDLPWVDDEGSHPYEFLTHWMPLPQPPIDD